MRKLVLLFVVFILLSISLNAQTEGGKPYIGIHTSGINLMGSEEPNQWKMWSGGQVGIYFSKRIGLEFSASKGWSRPKDFDGAQDMDEDGNIDYWLTYLTPLSISLKYNFTKDMISDIIGMFDTDICLITDVESKQEKIASSLQRYGFRQEYRDGIMYSYRNKD